LHEISRHACSLERDLKRAFDQLFIAI